MTRPSIASIVAVATSKLTLIVWGVVVAALASGVVYLGIQNNQHDQETESGEAALAVAVDNVPPILSYRAKTVDEDLAAAEKLLTGKFKTNFTDLGHDLVAPTAKRDRIDTKAQVAASALVSAKSDEVVALVFITQTTKGKTLKEPRVTGARLRITLKLVDGEWLVSDLQPV